jgi:hypothetical protein
MLLNRHLRRISRTHFKQKPTIRTYTIVPWKFKHRLKINCHEIRRKYFNLCTATNDLHLSSSVWKVLSKQCYAKNSEKWICYGGTTRSLFLLKISKWNRQSRLPVHKPLSPNFRLTRQFIRALSRQESCGASAKHSCATFRRTQRWERTQYRHRPHQRRRDGPTKDASSANLDEMREVLKL